MFFLQNPKQSLRCSLYLPPLPGRARVSEKWWKSTLMREKMLSKLLHTLVILLWHWENSSFKSFACLIVLALFVMLACAIDLACILLSAYVSLNDRAWVNRLNDEVIKHKVDSQNFKLCLMCHFLLINKMTRSHTQNVDNCDWFERATTFLLPVSECAWSRFAWKCPLRHLSRSCCTYPVNG